MKTILLLISAFIAQFFITPANAHAAGSVTLATSQIATANINQGTNTNVVYIVSMTVSATQAVTVNNIQFTLSGTHDANDLSTVYVYFNATSPLISGASYLGSAVATFAGPHAYSINVNSTLAAGTKGYFLITANVAANATDNHTIRITGATTPVTFGFTSATTVTNNQINGNVQTIQAADITLSTSTVAAANLNQGTNTNVIYITKMDVATEPVIANNVQFTLSGTHDANDLSTVYVYFNATAPVISGASYLGSAAANFAGPHAYSINIYNSLAAGTTGYYLITANVTTSATDNHTIRITGATTPVTFGFTTTPNVTNTQTNGGGLQTIQAADITVTTSPVAAATIYQSSNTNVLYTVKMNVSTEPVTVNNIQFSLNGSHDNDDLSNVYVYFNATSPVISGASYLGSAAANFAAPHAYSINIYNTLAAGTSGYYLITANVNSSATDNHTIRVFNGGVPVTFGFLTAPNATYSENSGGATQTIQAADITLGTVTVAAANLNQSSNTNIVYIAKMDVATSAVTANNIQFTLSGTQDNDDLSNVYVYFNATAPVISGASYLGSAAANFTAPHVYSINIYNTLSAGTTGYYLITVNVTSSATDNHTIRIVGSTNPVVFGFLTAPNVTNQQANRAGLQTIQAADITATTSPVAAGTIFQSSNTNVLYTVKLDVTTEPVTVNNIQFSLNGTQDNDDLSNVYVYFNATAPSISGASYLGSVAANFAAPHVYSINIYNTLAAGTSGYYLITVNVNSSATDNHTVRVFNGAVPVTFGFLTTPNVSYQENSGGSSQTIQAADITLTTSPVAAGNIVQGTNTNIIYIAKMAVQTSAVTVNNIQFTLTGTQDNDDFSNVYVYFNATAPVISGASYVGSSAANFAAPHDYSINIYNTLAAATSGYYLITVNVNIGASPGKTVQINGSLHPVTFGFLTTPNVTNSQTNDAGVKTISTSFSGGGVITSSSESSTIKDYKTLPVSVYPNPANNKLSYSINSTDTRNITVQLINVSGNVLLTKNESLNKGMNERYINVAAFTNGVYFLVIKNSKDNTVIKQQVTVQH
ncbi:hypothetical protein BH11BAC6_BH11BAC6_00360 [soil metagenome]